MDKELEKLKKEYEEKMKRKEEKKKDKDKDKDKGKEKAKEAEVSDKEKPEEPKVEKNVEIPSFSEYQLHRNFFNIRLEKYREKQIAKRNMERLKNPLYFPAVPKDGPV
ncbi:hypothetical protein AA313_de0204967 [Arthrobotrys entomopaga]|nr:hypothetical protein AA313_de0204967 [Arthrobotrys entomopaga]